MENHNPAQQRVAEHMATAMVQILSASAKVFPEPHHKLTLCMSASLVGLMGVIQGTVKNTFQDGFVPNDDHLMFSCLLMANCCYSGAHHPVNNASAFAVEFSMENIIKTLDQFHEITGRSFESQMNENLLKLVNTARNSAKNSISDTMGKFLPQ